MRLSCTVRVVVSATLPLLVLPAAVRADTAPVAGYGFEDTGTVAGDSSAYGNTGTVVGGATRGSGRFGTAIALDGSNDRVTIPDSGVLNLASGMTLEAWVNPAAVTATRAVMAKERTTANSYALYAAGPGTPATFTATDGEIAGAVNASALPRNTWSHLASTYDGTTLRLFINGTQVASSTASSGPLIPGAGVLSIGGNGLRAEWFSGLIDEVRVYNRALTAGEIQADMTTPVGSPATSSPGTPVSEAGSWSAPQPWPLVAVHSSMLSNGKVAVWDGYAEAVNSERVWDPETGSFVSTPLGVNLFCAGHALLPDGRLYVAGGHELDLVGLRDTELFNPLTGVWTDGPDMARGRWYPTLTTLPDGRVFIISGDGIVASDNPFFVRPSQTIPEIYNPKTNTLTALPSAGRLIPLYPFTFVAPDGRVVDAGPDQTTRLLDVQTGQWSTIASQSSITGGSAVMYRPGKILKTGAWSDTTVGSAEIHNRSQVLDLDQGVPAWRNAAPMKWGRSYHALTVLPDGDVLALGGQSRYLANSLADSPVLQPEIWSPATDTWKPVASHIRPRGYHTTSLLLPDGRVLMAGSGRLNGSLMVNEQNAEIYSPPYLHKGPRPTIASAPATMDYGSTVDVETPDAARIAKVSLVRIGAMTHTFNMDQRWQELSFRQAGDRLQIDTPTSGNVAPPGVYYLFLVDGNGVPSKAAILSIFPPTEKVPPSQVTGLNATGSIGRVALAWNAATDNVGVTRYAVHRSTTAGFTPSSGNRVAHVAGTSYADTGLVPGTYHYRVLAEDEALNAGPPSAQASATATADTASPVVSLTAPAAGTTVSGGVAVNATATDDGAVAGVQFKLDGQNLGAEDTSAPYSVTWDTTTAAAGAHTLSAVARDGAGNSATAATISVTVNNTAPPGPVAVAAYSFEEGAGATVIDATGKGHTGTIREAAWTTSGRNRKALQFDGTNDWVSVDDAADLRLSSQMTLEAWVYPTTMSGWRTAIMKERAGDLAYALYSSGVSSPSAYIGASPARWGTALAANTWSHLAATYDGTTLRLYVNGVQRATNTISGALAGSTGALRLGGNGVWGEYFAGRLDDVRIYATALTAAQVTSDMNTPVGPGTPADTSPPSAPGNVAATDALGRVTLAWSPSTDNVGVTRYAVHRSATPGFTPAAGNRLGYVTTPGYVDAAPAPGTYYYRVLAEDAAGSTTASAEVVGRSLTDTSPPSAPGNVTATDAMGRVTLNWTASTDDVGVTRYAVYRSATAGFAPGAANRLGFAVGTSFADTPLTVGTYYYVVAAEDAAGNVGASAEVVGRSLADTTPPSAPTGVNAAGALGRITLSWNASTDDVGVVRYAVHRSTTAGFTAVGGNRIAFVTATSYADLGLTPGDYHYRVVAEDAAGNAGTSAVASGTALADTTAPTVSITAPGADATLRGATTVTAGATDDVGVTSVQFVLDGADLGAPDTSSPYSAAWDTTTAPAGAHSITAIARDAAGNTTTAATVSVTVDNSVPAGPQPVAAYSFEEGAGTALTDRTGKGHTGTIREAAWTTAGRNGRALQFDGVNDWVTIEDALDLRLSGALTLEAWVYPTSVSGWRTALLKERAGDLAYALYASGSPRASGYLTSGSVQSSAALANNTWTHLAATYDGATLRVYLNGVQRGTLNVSNGLSASAGALRLGGNSVWGEYFAGRLDDVRIYDTALTAAQVTTDMNTPVG